MDTKQINLELENKYINKKREIFINQIIDLKNRGVANATPMGATLGKIMLKNCIDNIPKLINQKIHFRGHRRVAFNYILKTQDYLPNLLKATIDTVINKIFKEVRPTLSNVTISVGKLLEVEIALILIKEDNPKLFEYYKQKWKHMPYFTLSKVILENSKHLINLELEQKAYLANFLIDFVIEINKELFVIKNIRRKRGHTKKIIMFSSDAEKIILKIIKKTKDGVGEIAPLMLIEPKNINLENNTVGYYKLVNTVVAHKPTPPFIGVDALNAINKVSKITWRINNKVIEVIKEVIKNKIVSKNSTELTKKLIGELPYPDVITPKSMQEIGIIDEKKEFKKYMEYVEALKEWEVRIRGQRSIMWETLRQVEEVQELTREKEPIVYIPHNFDYRGRIYGSPTYLSFMRESWVKSLFKLAKKEKLTNAGWYWLKIHIANMFGLDKKPFEDRIKWVEDNEDLILNIANNPINTVYDWDEADEPYLFLASCFAYKEAKETGYTDIPIQLDATCSGIQMYSGLLRDRDGALAVNVIGNTRNDIYQIVADKVNKALAEGSYPKTFEYSDKEGGVNIYSNDELAKQLAGKITRKIVKRPVMTLPYSVTPRGMYEQIADEIHDMLLEGKEFWDKEKFAKWQVTKLIQVVTKKAIEDTVYGGVVGQTIIKDIVREYMNKYPNRPIKWVSPGGFEVIYYIEREVHKRICTSYGKISFYKKTGEQNKIKILNGIAPNFIHSIDASVLYGVVNRSKFDIGIIHDCFLSHPNYGDSLQDNYKDSFIDVMKSNPLKQFADALEYDGEVDLLNTLDLEEIRDSRYIIS